MPLTIATVRGAPPSRIGSVSDRCSGTSKPSIGHQTSAPPPKEKKERKKLVAAKAMERPKTIWISRRKPPELSPKASDKPVMTMMITATMRATGPSMDSQDLRQRRFPGHARAGGMGRRRQSGEQRREAMTARVR